MAQNIKIGENLIWRGNLIQKDGSAILLATGGPSGGAVEASVDLIQNGKVLESLTYPSANFRQGETTSQLEYEIIRSISNLFTKGNVTIKVTVTVSDSDFDTESVQKKVYEKLIANVK